MSVYLQISRMENRLFSRRFAKVQDTTIRRRVLRIFGQEIRKRMRRNIRATRQRPDGTFKRSVPGRFPFARLRKGESKSRNKFVGSAYLIYQYDPASESVVVGPRQWKRNRAGKPMPQVLEQGGTSIVTPLQGRRIKRRKIGDGGEIRIGGNAVGRDERGRFLSGRKGLKPLRDTNLGDVWVAYAKLRTAGQVRRANRIQLMLFGKQSSRSPMNLVARRISVAARPYARPTLDWFVGSEIPNNVLTRVLNKAIMSSGGLARRKS